MTSAEILSLAYQRQAAGDARPLVDIVAAIRADEAALSPAPSADDVVMAGRLVYPGGRVVSVIGYGDGRKVETEE